jgi:hypothetical protein
VRRPPTLPKTLSRRPLGLSLLAPLLLVAGCSSIGNTATRSTAPADNTAAICAQWTASIKPFTSTGADEAPEAKAYQKAMADAYDGKGMPEEQEIDIQHAYWSAQEKEPRKLAAQATEAELRDALTAYADELDGRSEDVLPEFVGMTSPARQQLDTLCKTPEPGSSAG